MRRAILILPLLAFVSLSANAGCTGKYKKDDIPLYRKQLKASEPWVRTRAARALFVLGADAKEAIPDLVYALGDGSDSVRNYSANALVRIGPDSAYNLTQALDSGSDVKRLACVWVLGRLGPGPNVVEGLMKGLDDSSEPVRISAADSLGDLGPDAKDALQKLHIIATSRTVTAATRSAVKDAIKKIEGGMLKK